MGYVTLKNGVEFQPGCIFDGHLGWHNTYRIIDLALEQSQLAKDGGFGLDAEDRKHVDAYRAGDQVDENTFEIVQEIADEADTYLNGLAPEGYGFAWHDGEYFFETDEENESWG